MLVTMLQIEKLWMLKSKDLWKWKTIMCIHVTILLSKQNCTERCFFAIFNHINQRKMQILISEKLETNNIWHFCLISDQNDELIIKIVTDQHWLRSTALKLHQKKSSDQLAEGWLCCWSNFLWKFYVLTCFFALSLIEIYCNYYESKMTTAAALQ